MSPGGVGKQSGVMPLSTLRVEDGEPGLVGGIKPAWSKEMEQSGFGFFSVFPIDIKQFFDRRDILANVLGLRAYAPQSFT